MEVKPIGVEMSSITRELYKLVITNEKGLDPEAISLQELNLNIKKGQK